MSDKKSFVLYFDMYPSIKLLPADQRGELFSALFEYAEAEIMQEEEGGLSNKEWILLKHPQMDAGTRMAFSFIAETIHRDTEKWRGKLLRYQKAAEKRWENKKQTPYYDGHELIM